MKKILIVDDDVELSEGLAELLKTEGYSVCLVKRGEDAVKEFRRQRFDLVVLDYKLEGMNGRETLIELMKIAPEVKVIFISGNPFIEKIKEEKKLSKNIVSALSKPFNIEEFIAAVKSACL